MASLGQLEAGPVIFITNEDGVLLSETIDHAKSIGFPNIVVCSTDGAAPEGSIGFKQQQSDTTASILNGLIPELNSRWICWVYNAEFLYFPYSDTRTVSDAVQFLEEEKRDAAAMMTVDLYPDIETGQDTNFDRDAAWFDAAGYFSKDRYDGPNRQDRQIEVYGGLKWRFAEYIPWERRSASRLPFFRAADDLRVLDDLSLSDPERNTIACPWHHSMTMSVASWRVARSLISNPDSRAKVEKLTWSHSEKFNWTATQLMEHGFLEPGQWF